MSDSQKEEAPSKGHKEKPKSDDRQARLADALRANLRRRKEQDRNRRQD